MHKQENIEGHVDSNAEYSTSNDVDEALEPEKTEYQRYQERGGIFNEKDFISAQARAKQEGTRNRSSIAQAESMAERAKMALETSADAIDPRVALYEVLRSDVNPGVEHHHSQMSDQRLFAEVLRMSGDMASLDKLKEAYPRIPLD